MQYIKNFFKYLLGVALAALGLLFLWTKLRNKVHTGKEDELSLQEQQIDGKIEEIESGLNADAPDLKPNEVEDYWRNL